MRKIFFFGLLSKKISILVSFRIIKWIVFFIGMVFFNRNVKVVFINIIIYLIVDNVYFNLNWMVWLVVFSIILKIICIVFKINERLNIYWLFKKNKLCILLKNGILLLYRLNLKKVFVSIL